MSIGTTILRSAVVFARIAENVHGLPESMSLALSSILKIDQKRADTRLGIFKYRLSLMGFTVEVAQHYTAIVQKGDDPITAIAQATIETGIDAIRNRMIVETQKEVCVTASYLKERCKRSTYTLMVAALGILASLAAIAAGYHVSIWTFLLISVVGIAPFVDLLLAKYRFESGFFGNNEREARDIVRYIIANSDKFDADDGNFKVFEADMRRIQAWSPAAAIAGQTA